jgi:NAD(P)-dependent dehydrogenase (short-subunit alcohol dehydrogenase family)
MKLANKVAVITGAGSGMGKAAALIFASEGAKVAAADIVEAQVKETAAEITRKGGDAIALRADVAKSEDVKRMIDDTVAKYGGLNIIYNNAGIEGESNFMSNMTEEQFDHVIAINLRGVFLGMKYALPHLIKAGGGSIINQASIAGMVAVRGGRGVFGREGGRDRAHPRRRAGIRPLQHPCQRDLPGRDRNSDGAADSARPAA